MSYFWKDRDGNKISYKEFMRRFKEGVSNITPQQKLKSNITGTRISLIGLFIGLILSIWEYKTLWWVGIILIGALINTIVQYYGFKQQLKIFEDIEKMVKEPENKEEKPEEKLELDKETKEIFNEELKGGQNE